MSHQRRTDPGIARLLYHGSQQRTGGTDHVTDPERGSENLGQRTQLVNDAQLIEEQAGERFFDSRVMNEVLVSLVKKDRYLPLQLIRQARGDFVDITDGLNAGETVVTSGVFKLRTGAKVVIDNTLAPKARLAPRPGDS